MGFLSHFIGVPPATTIERRLEASYVPMFEKFLGSRKEAKECFDAMFGKVKQESDQQTHRLPPNYGDLLLQNEDSNDAAKRALAQTRREGATDADIQRWWNLHEYERGMMKAVEDWHIQASWLALLRQGLDFKEAADKVKKDHVRYGDPDDVSAFQGDDRPLPPELRERVNRYMERRAQTDPEVFNCELLAATTTNAHIRAQIRRGQV